MAAILIMIVFVLAAIFFVNFSNKSQSTQSQSIQEPKKDFKQLIHNPIPVQKSPPVESSKKKSNSETSTYKAQKLRQFDIVGAYYQNVDKSDCGYFVGKAVCDYNEHDTYAVAIYNETKQIGFTPKNNKRLNESIYSFHSGKIICWGRLSYSNYMNSYTGTVYIPVGMPYHELDFLNKLISIKREITVLDKTNVSDIIEYMKKFEQANELISKIDPKWIYGLERLYPPTWEMIRIVLKSFEEKEQWGKIIELKKFCDDIGNKQQKKIILNKIDKAIKKKEAG